MTEAEKLKKVAELFRKSAETANKFAAVLEDENATEEEIDNAAKDYTWQVMKIANMQENVK